MNREIFIFIKRRIWLSNPEALASVFGDYSPQV